jgi:hypothetical protein
MFFISVKAFLRVLLPNTNPIHSYLKIINIHRMETIYWNKTVHLSMVYTLIFICEAINVLKQIVLSMVSR